MTPSAGAHAETRVGGAGEQQVRRTFADEAGVLWTAELRRPRRTLDGGQPAAPLILFWSDTRACLATLRTHRQLSDLTEDELRRHLRACLVG